MRRAPAGDPPPPLGGHLEPLTATDVERVTRAAFDLLATVGLSGLPETLLERVLAAGATRRADGRVRFPRALVEDLVARAAKRVPLPGFDAAHGIEVGGGRVHIGTGGAAVQMLDGDTLTFAPSTLNDLYELMWLTGACRHIDYALRPVVARDLEDPWLLDVNTAFAAMKATPKPIGTSFTAADHVAPVVEMLSAGKGVPFAKHPYCFAAICHVVPPLRFAEDACAVLEQCVALGMPVQLCSAPQAGATSPAALAGTLTQCLAESLAGLALTNILAPGFGCILAAMPFISDLRTGAMSGGGGEAAIASAAMAQLLRHLDLPGTVFAGITDAKTADVQAGYEKGYTVALAAQAGADMINLSVGMLGSIMAASREALVIDDEMCGAILRTVRGVEVTEDNVSVEQFEAVVGGEGHFLGEASTLALMRTEYLYPVLADRRSIDDWLGAGREDIWARARRKVRDVLSTQPPTHLPRSAEEQIRAAFPVQLNR